MNQQFKSGQAQFRYSGREKYIKLIEKFIDDDKSIQRCFLLDPELSIIHRQREKDINLEELSGVDEVKIDKILYLIQEQPPKCHFEKGYQKYYEIDDFLIGRENWGRTINAMKMSSDMVSRDHTRLAINNKTINKDSLLKILKQTINIKTRRSSKWRKLPLNLLQKVVQYSLVRPYYSVEDCGSRNGTYLLDYSLLQNEIKIQECYQFQHQNYTIQINHMKKVIGLQLDALLSMQSQKFQINRRLNYQRSEVLPQGLSRKQLQSNQNQYYWISLEFYVSHEFKFYHEIINNNQTLEYPIGEGQLLNVSSTEDSINTSRHGILKFEGGKWFIAAFKSNERVWTKLQPKKKYQLNKNKYKIMVAHHSVVEIELHNFD